MRTFNVPAVARADKANVVHVSVDQIRKRVCLGFYPAERTDDGRVVIHITSGHSEYTEEMPRLNNEQLDVVAQMAKEQIEAKSGPYYDLLKASAAKIGMVLA